MIALTAEELAGITAGKIVGGNPDTIATAVKIDSRGVARGDCFVAIRGPRDDGHRYLQSTVAAGASVLLIERADVLDHLVGLGSTAVVGVADTTAALQALAAHTRATVDPVVVAVTGSVGKTTTKTLTYELLRHSRSTHVTPGNFNNQWGLPLSLLGLEPGHEWMVAELGMSAAGEIAALTRLARPDIGVITNVAPVHMENFASVDGVAAAKRELAEGLPPGGTLIVNADDPRTARIGTEVGTALGRVITFGRHHADIAAANVTKEGHGWCFELRIPGTAAMAIELPLPGEHSIANFLAAVAAAHAIGVEPTIIPELAPRLRLPAMRGEIHQTAGGAMVLDDSYNASPAAMISAIDALAELPGDGRLLLAAGDMRELGIWSEDAHREVGLHAAQLGYAKVFTVGVLARDIGAGARAGGLPSASVESFSTAGEAAEAIDEQIQPGDRLLVKGSRAMGMEAITMSLTAATDKET